MAYQSLYRRYRPRRFDEVRGQEHVVGALRNAVDNNSVTHAYLFSGPRGTGKTSTARILAKALNCENLQKGEPCCDCTPCQDMEAGRSFDLFELDAASNNGVDAIRDLIERTAVGSPGRTKVYILDEVHMLSPAASNALLKTLEEPPGHVRFVLATTDPQKVLPTIRSRTQHFEFQLLSADELERYVRWIIADADLDVDEAGITWAVRQGRGSARDTLSALDQVVAAGGVVERTEPIEKLFEALVSKDSGVAIVAVADALAQGHDPRVLAKVFLDSLRDTFMLSLGAEVPHMMADDADRMGGWARQIGTPLLTRAMESIGSAMVDMRQAADPRVPFEVALVRLTTPASGSLAELSERIEKLEQALATGSPVVAAGAGSAGATTRRRPTEPASGVPETSSVTSSPPSDGRPNEGDSGDAGSSATRGDMSAPAKARAELARQRAARGETTQDRPSGRPGPKARGSETRNLAGAPPVPPSARSGEVSTASQAPVDPDPDLAPAAAEPSAPEPPAQAPAAPPASTPAEPQPAEPQSAGSGPEPESGAQSAPPETAQPPRAESATAPASSGEAPTVAELEAAMESAVLAQIRGVAKAIYAQGHFVSVSNGVAVFAVENAPTRDRAEKSRPEIESLLSAHFGRPVSIRVADKDSAGGPSGGLMGGGARSGATGGFEPPGSSQNDHRGPATSRRPGSQESSAEGETGSDRADDSGGDEEEDLMTIDVTQLEDAKGIAETGLDRLLSAFPGATLIEANEEK
ncbi:MAG TPA: DNA polymerase III subunit gamma/tau [Microthrixaceae bacterium]|nr:DNA polymerase III subunit gamma/tau [Microthrixaceae bacterium]